MRPPVASDSHVGSIETITSPLAAMPRFGILKQHDTYTLHKARREPARHRPFCRP